MAQIQFSKWLAAVNPAFPEFAALADFVATDAAWPLSSTKSDLRKHLIGAGQNRFTPLLARALSAYNLLCTRNGAPEGGEGLPLEQHTPKLVEIVTKSRLRHSRNRQIPTWEYRRELTRTLARQMASKIRIYIDTCHWVKMRDFELGRQVPAIYGQILADLRRLVASGKFICPISSTLALELLTQNDPHTRLHTALLMGELSHGIGLPRIDEMEESEIRKRFLPQSNASSNDNAEWEVWTKAIFLFGESMPESPDWIQKEEDIWFLQKQYLDMVWNAEFHQIINVLDALPSEKLKGGFARIMNDDKDGRPAESFELERQRACALATKHIVVPAFAKIAAESAAFAEKHAGFRMTVPPMASSNRDPYFLPSIQIVADIEALIRTSGRKFRDNDMLDMVHTAAAIPYCHVFFCDKAFKHIIEDPKLAYPQKYGIKVLSSSEEIAELLSAYCATEFQ